MQIESVLAAIESDTDCSIIEVIEGLDTMLVFVNNIIDYPQTPCFRRIRISNVNFQERLGHLKHGMDLLKAVGFVQDADPHVFALPDSVDEEDERNSIANIRKARLSIISFRKELYARFMHIQHLPADHVWSSVRGAGAFGRQGRRPHMEDEHLLIDSFTGDPSTGLFCCYDGHGGRAAVDFCVRSLHIVYGFCS
uniref:Uncharacterized protein n=1 Tax=Spongospora subterranea TaxID=70186 RepID=A0A0H5QSK1_9EUKA|eukprot:CRZ04642.1 hypothetical protein [Spongospora subterranea]